MKSLLSLLASFVFFSSLLLAEQIFQRGVSDRIIGFGFLQKEEVITLDRPVEDLQGTARQAIPLFTPDREADNGHKLLLDSKRSIVLINKSNIDEINPDLALSILEVVNNKSKALLQNNFEYDKNKLGLENFYVMANFEAARTAEDASEWFVAILPKDVEVLQVILQTEWFGGGAGAHNQIRMILDTPVVGIPHDQDESLGVDEEKNQKSTRTPYIFNRDQYRKRGDIVFTLQAARVAAQEEKGDLGWDPIKGVMGEFGNALQFFDTQTLALDQISRSVIDELTVINASHAKPKSPERIRATAVLDKAISLSNGQNKMSIYNTVFASCVTFALKALKAGVPTIDTTWFNPYSLNDKVIAAAKLKNKEVNAALNKEYKEIAKSNGIEVMTRQKIKDKNPQITELVTKIEEPILKSDVFDDIIRKLALYIIDKKITYDEVAPFIAKAKQTGVEIGDITPDGVKQEELQIGLAKIEALWKDSFKSPIKRFFDALDGLQTQESEQLD